MKFALLTDTHLVPPGETLYTISPAERLAAALRSINADHPDVAFIMISGDLAHHGQLSAYTYMRDTLSIADAPVRLMMGNHDRRNPFCEAFPDAPRSQDGFIHWTETYDAFSMIVLDTLDEGGPGHAGILCEPRLEFLKSALAAAPTDRPLLLFQHHPPFETGMPAMDIIRLRNGTEEWQAISDVRKPDYLFMGHLHRPISGNWHGIPFHIQRAIAHQVDLSFESAQVPGTLKAPDYSIVMVKQDTIVIHQTSYTYSGPRFWLDDASAQNATSPNELKR